MHNIIKKGTLYLEKKTRKTSNHTDIRQASKEILRHVFYSKYSAYSQEAREQINGSI